MIKNFIGCSQVIIRNEFYSIILSLSVKSEREKENSFVANISYSYALIAAILVNTNSK